MEDAAEAADAVMVVDEDEVDVEAAVAESPHQIKPMWNLKSGSN
jgi:hypothetical protein